MNVKVSDPDLFLIYFSRSDRSLEGQLARYQLYNSSDQLLNDTRHAFWECFSQVDTSLTLNYFDLLFKVK